MTLRYNIGNIKIDIKKHGRVWTGFIGLRIGISNGPFITS
jgi:hypothetical protein